MAEILTEIKRSLHISKTKLSDNYYDQSHGKNRYYRRMTSRVDKSVLHLNRLDFNKVFKDGILDIELDVQGETNKYVVRISFGHFMSELHKEVMKEEARFSLPVVTRALILAFNTDDVLVRCSCPDFNFRQSYYLSMNGGIAGEMETRPSNITNPDDTKGSGCKHIQAVLSNNSWLQRVGRVIYNYVTYMLQHYDNLYAEVIYPSIYEKEYDDSYLMGLDLSMDKDDLDSNDLTKDSDMIDTANKWAREKSKFLPGNNYRFLKLNTDDPNLLALDLDLPEKEFDIESELSN